MYGFDFELDDFQKEAINHIENGKSADEIRASWKADLEAFKAIRAKYLMY